MSTWHNRQKKKMRRILYISNYKQGVGGISAQIDLLCQSIEAEIKSEGVKTLKNESYLTSIYSTKGNPIKRVWLFVKLMFAARKYDVLHVHGCSGWGMVPVVYGVIAGKIWRKKIIVTYHGGGADNYFEKHGKFARRWLMRADEVIVLSGFLKKVFDKYQISCLEIPNIVILREDIYQPKRSIAPKFISVRHLTELYQIDLIIKAFEQVQKHYPEATLDILGQGECRAGLEQYVKLREKREEIREGSVRFIGQVPNEKIYDYLRANDVMLSAPKIDNMPVSLLEAMNAGVLVITSNVGGVPYMINHKENGLLWGSEELRVNSEETSEIEDRRLKIEDWDGLAEQIMWALEHQEECLQIIAKAKIEVQKYSWHNIRKQLLPLYE